MAELGVIVSVLQIADIGLRLSLRLYTLSERVASADRSIISDFKDVSLTSTIRKSWVKPWVAIELLEYALRRQYRRPRLSSKDVWDFL